MITHVAIWHNNQLVALPPPYRHHNLFQLITNRDYNGFEIQGFLDGLGNFLDRREAYIHAKAHNQVKRSPDPIYYQGDELFSEDLW